MRRINLNKPRQVFDGLLTWLASLRIRLIVTYVFVTALSFGFLILQLVDPVRGYIERREEDLLNGIAITLGSTIRSVYEQPLKPQKARQNYLDDLRWTQRRCRNYLCKRVPGLRVRIVDPDGRVVLDSADTQDWDVFYRTRFSRPTLSNYPEIQRALKKGYEKRVRPSEEAIAAAVASDEHPVNNMYIALPIVRTNVNSQAHEQKLAFIMYLDRPMSMLSSNLREMQDRIRVSLVTSLLITMLVSIVLASNLSAGLNAATRIARAFARGDLGQRMRARGRDEVGQLGHAFNQMADALQRQEGLRRDLLADVSHELRTPLTAIAGCADTLADGTIQEDPAAAEHFLGIIMRESERMQRLVSDILELSKLQSGVVEIRRAPLPVIPLIDDAVEIAGLNARGEGLTLEWSPPAKSEELLVLGNEDRLAQALRNLLDNARHHTPSGRKIYVTLAEEAEEIVIRVRDEGEGIPPGDLPWVFDRFYRAGKGGTKTGGTGLGLAIVREIMLAHQGRVTVESELGRGTTFSLHLPRAQAEQGTTGKIPVTSGT
ncbi:MAG: sensor histidine kinase [Armatimonadota bacterium]